MIAVVDYGRGNLGSVQKALAELAPRVVVTDDPVTVARADTLVVPGDGAFADAMASLERLGLGDPIRAHIATGRPYLGICLGYQLLFTESEEFGHAKGLDILPGVVRRFPPGLKVPHMGWNRLWHDGTLPLLEGIPSGAYFYFVHSYYVVPKDSGVIATETNYSTAFCSMIWRDNLLATQFHPEKSQRQGLQMLANFAAM